MTEDADRTVTGEARRKRSPATNAQKRSTGDKLGRYTIVEEIGQGGMGVVYEAYDADLDRRIALKLLHPRLGESHGADRARFVREAQALAKLAHPNVVPVFDVGVHAGEVFLAMELIAGCDFRRWLDASKRSWREILEVLVQAGRGLAHAHAAGLVHRDFKPANVLVGDDGRPRVLDFGLARAVRPQTSSDPSRRSAESVPALASPVTRAGDAPGTPAYMAPEQLRGGEVDERSDQYSFCVSAWEAFYGDRPTRAVDQGAITDRSGRSSGVPAWIRLALLRGLDLDPSRRYPTMGELLERLARNPAAARRRYLAFGVVIVGVLGVAGAAAAGTFGDNPCARVGDATATLWDDADRAIVHDAFGASGRGHAADTFARLDALITSRVEALTAMREQSCEATHVTGTQSEAMLDLRASCMNGHQSDLGALVEEFAASDDPRRVDEAVRAVSGVATLDRCADTSALASAYPPPQDADVAAEVAGVREQIARVSALYRLGRYKEGLELGESTVTVAEATGYPPVIAQSLERISDLYRHTGDSEGEERAAKRLARAAGAAKDDHLAATAAISLLFVLSRSPDRAGEFDSVHALAESAVERAGASDKLVGRLESVLSSAAFIDGDFDAALERQNNVVEIEKRWRGPDDPELGYAYSNVATILRRLGRHGEALEVEERSLELRTRLLGEDHPAVALSLQNIGSLYDDMGRHEDARRSIEKALELNRRTLGDDELQVASSLTRLGVNANRRGDPVEALRLQRQAIAIREKRLGPTAPPVTEALHNIASALYSSNRLAEARAEALKCYERREKVTPGHPENAITLSLLASIATKQDELEQALEYGKRAVEIHEATLGPDHPDLAISLGTAAAVASKLERYEEALPWCRRALQLEEKKAEVDSHHLLQPLTCLGRALVQTGSRPDGLTYLERALRAAEAGRRPREIATAKLWVADALDKKHRKRSQLLAEEALATLSSEDLRDNNAEKIARARALLRRR